MRMDVGLRRGLQLLVPLLVSVMVGFHEGQGQRFECAFLGDNPYSGSANVPEFEELIEDVNGHGGIQWVIHVGDTKAGTDSCSD